MKPIRHLVCQAPAFRRSVWVPGLLALAALPCATDRAAASIAYGSINNFDTVNDTGHECHGFEIELEDCRSTDISYTFDWNHYGVPKISQDDSIPGHPKCTIRWAAVKNSNGTWSAFTAIPSGPLAPTNGHQFTNPSVNFGGEHFGTGYTAAVGAVRYRWLIDDGNGVLIDGGAVQVATPVFVYYPPVAGQGGGQVQAEIQPPPPPEVHPIEFGNPVWVKEIRTTSHNNNKVKLRDLLSDDPDRADDKNWKNGEPDEVETEWELLQTEFNKVDGGKNGKKQAAPEDLNQGDEVVTRRYEFFKYTGPLDAETGEAMCDSVGPDSVHGAGLATINGVEVDLATLEVVGDFTGAQMAAVDVDAAVGLIEHVTEGEADTAYASRALVVPGAMPFSCVRTGDLPDGMSFDEVTGILSGTPAAAGDYQFKVTATDGMGPDVSRSYTLRIAPAGEALAVGRLVDTLSDPPEGGTTAGDGAFAPGDSVTVTAEPAVGFHLVNWQDQGAVVGTGSSYTFVVDINHSLTAHFAPDTVDYAVAAAVEPAAGGTVTGSGVVVGGSNVTLTAVANAGYAFVNWTEGGVPVSTTPTWTFTAAANRTVTANFIAAVSYSISTSAVPASGGSIIGGGSKADGSSVTVKATPNAGYTFVNWTEGGNPVSTNSNYTFTVSAARSLTANFVVVTASTPVRMADQYTVTDITTWTAAQRATLPYFDRYVSVPPAGASADFIPVVQNGFGTVAGYRDYLTGLVQSPGAIVTGGVTTTISAWGQYVWDATAFDGQDAHGIIGHSPVTDVAFTGRPVGYANLPGINHEPDSATAWQNHAFLYDPASGTKIDLTPDAFRAEAGGINDREEIVGTWENGDGAHAFKRHADGTMEEFETAGFDSLTPRLITNRGLVAGTYAGPEMLPFATSGLVPEALGLPASGSPDSARITDANDHGLIVGSSYQAAHPDEPAASRWYQDGGEWVAEEINDLLKTNEFLIDNCLAVNDAGYIIATGHVDGTDTFQNRTLLLTPDKVPPPSVITLDATGLTPISAVLRAKINACTKTTTVTFSSGASTVYIQSAPATTGATINGMAPAVAAVTLTGLSPHTTYHFRASAVNSKGTTHGEDLTFTTPYDWGTWSADQFGGGAVIPGGVDPDADDDHDGESNFAEYAFGHEGDGHGSRHDQTAEMAEDGFSLTWTRPADHSGVSYEVQVATTLAGPWHSGEGYTETVDCHSHGRCEIRRERSLLPAATFPVQFMRIVARGN